MSGDEWVMQDVPIFYSYRRPCDFNSIIQNQKTTVFTWKEFSYHLTDTTTDQLGDHVWLFEEQADTYPILYVCSAAGVFLAFCLHLGFAPALLLGRLFNLTAFALLSAWAVKKAPFGKMAFVGAALLPMTLHQAASFSRDSLLLGLCFAFTALCLDLAYAPGSALCWQKLVPLAVMGVVIAPAKVVYAPLIALVLLAAAAVLRRDRMRQREAQALVWAFAAALGEAESAIRWQRTPVPALLEKLSARERCGQRVFRDAGRRAGGGATQGVLERGRQAAGGDAGTGKGGSRGAVSPPLRGGPPQPARQDLRRAVRCGADHYFTAMRDEQWMLT